MNQIDVAVNTDALDEWIEYRKIELKKPLKDMGIQKVMNKLKMHPYEVQQQMVDQSIENGWRGLFEVKQEAKKEQPVSDFVSTHTDTSWAIGL